MKRLLYILNLVVIVLAAFFTLSNNTVVADETEIEMEPMVTSNGTYVYYKHDGSNVMLPTEYDYDTYFRSVWVTPLAGCIPSYSNDTQYKREILEIFDVMEYYNLNALIFHIRIMNDALYASKLNPTSGYLDASWDVLEWIIDECHKRGYEFHAWMNPYRVKASGATSVESEAQKIKNKCPANVGSNPANLLINSSGGVILNPGLEVVRQFIVDTCMEVIENYDVDAIHFDDYFYITGVDDSALYNSTNPNGLSLSDWRREQVNLFIELLHDTVEAYNIANNRYVQIGISPTGIYRNGDGNVTYDEDGNAISSGSCTGGQEHYESYLFSDTVKWINEEWIDYIMPQSYWAFTHKIAGYADVMSWWNKIVKYKNVNLYSGMGIYMSENPGSNYSWGYDPYESYNQIKYASTLENCDGTVFYNYTYLERSYKGETGNLYNTGLSRVKQELFNNKAILPIIKSFEPVVLSAPKNITYNKGENNISISFDSVENAKMYVIYRSSGNITFDEDEVYDIIYADSSLDRVTYVDENVSKDYNYAIRTQSKTNHLSEDAALATFIRFNVKFLNNKGQVLKEQYVNYGGEATPPTISDSDFIGWSKNYKYITSDLVITPRYTDSDYYVNFYNENGELIETKTTKFGGTVEAPEYKRDGFVLTGWDKDFSKVEYDIDLYPIFAEKICTVTFVDWDDTELSSISVKYGHDGYYPEDPSRRAHKFIGWDKEVTEVKDDMIIKALYEVITYKVTFINGLDNSVITEVDVVMYEDATPPTPPVVKGYEFYSWRGNYTNVTCDVTVKANYEEACYEILFKDSLGNTIYELYYFISDGIEYPELPVYDGYEFVEWDRDLNDIYENMTITAIYKKTSLNISFVDNFGNVISEVTVKNGEEIVYPIAPEIQGYEFSGWDKELTTALEDTVITGSYVKKVYKVSFVDSLGNKLSENEYTFDEKVVYPETKEIEGYTFDGWDKEIEFVTEDTTITAVYNKIPLIKVSYVYNGKEIWSEEILKGSDATFGFEVPEYDGYVFDKFDSDGKTLTEDTVITLLYNKVAKKGCGNTLAIINSIFMVSFIMSMSIIFKKR